MHYCQNATKFVPDLGKVGASTLEKLAAEEGLSPQTISASKNLDVVLNGLRENSSEGVDYFQVLVDVFSNELNGSSNAHLQVNAPQPWLLSGIYLLKGGERVGLLPYCLRYRSCVLNAARSIPQLAAIFSAPRWRPQLSASQGSSTTVSRSDIRIIIQHLDSSAHGLARRWL
jgi:hypothetical protein